MLPATRDGARLVAQPYLEGGPRLDMIAPYGASVAECVAMALPGMAEEMCARYARVALDGEIVPPDYWPRVRLTPRNDNLPVIVITVAPGNGGALRGVLSIAVGVAALALGGVWASPLVGALGFSGVAGATSVAGGLITATTLLAGTLLINSLVPLRRDASTSGGPQSSPTYQITGLRNVANPEGVIPYVFGDVVFAPPYAALPYTTAEGGNNYVIALFLIGPGPVEISEMKLGDTPIENFKEVQTEVFLGLPGDDYSHLYPKQVLEERQTVSIKQVVDATGPYRHFTASDAAECQLDMSFPSGLSWYHTFGNPPHTVPLPASVDFLVSYRLNGVGAWTALPLWTCYGYSTEAITFTNRFKFPTRGRYEIKVERLSIDYDDLNNWNETDKYVTVSILSAIRSFRPEYPVNFDQPLALVALKIRASKQLAGVVDNFNCRVKRVALDWDSGAQTWTSRATRNPAAALRWAMQGPGARYAMPDDMIDLVGLAEFSEFCEAKGLSFDRVVDYEASEYDVWGDICAAGRASPRFDGEQWGIVIDRPQTIVMQHITPANSWDFSGEIDYPIFPEAFAVKFNDRENMHKPATRVVPWIGFVGTPTRVESISFPGVTDAAQAYREARRRMRELIHRRERWSLMMDFEGVTARRGDLVLLNHDVLLETQGAARVKYVGPDYVQIDGVVTLAAGVAYGVRFRSLPTSDDAPDVSTLRRLRVLSESELALYGAPNGDGTISTDLLFCAAGDAMPAIGDLVQFGPLGQESIECVVKDVEAADNLARRLTLIPHAPEISTETDAETAPAWSPRVGEILDGYVPALAFNAARNSQYLMLGAV